mgnify:FL=1
MTPIQLGAAALVLMSGAALRGRVAPPRRVGARRVRHPRVRTRDHRRAEQLGLAAAAAAALVLSPLLAGIGIAVVALLRRVRPVVALGRQRRAIERALPDAVDLLVLSVRAGLTPSRAVAELAQAAPESTRDAFRLVVHRTERGSPFADALAALPQELGPSAAGLADVIATADRHGLPLGPMLDQLSAEAREARRRLDQSEARKLPVRLSFPLVACTLPAFVLLAIAPAVIAALSSLGGSAW